MLLMLLSICPHYIAVCATPQMCELNVRKRCFRSHSSTILPIHLWHKWRVCTCATSARASAGAQVAALGASGQPYSPGGQTLRRRVTWLRSSATSGSRPISSSVRVGSALSSSRISRSVASSQRDGAILAGELGGWLGLCLVSAMPAVSSSDRPGHGARVMASSAAMACLQGGRLGAHARPCGAG